ncbi:hypothetical protein CRE_06812 [Caenorhabditis remanei]|uniref:Uncharacterized protein n=1 Tax=Caenorhabditis remanei TaxID=31234 RepID=E3MNX5_CAERE|nr:hypothetical protein CRE_06812 [Caenorhabditis remanei]
MPPTPPHLNLNLSTTTEPPLPLFTPGVRIHPEFAQGHCFIDEKLRKEVELFHVIGVRNADAKMMIAGPHDSFNFRFFEAPTVTASTVEVTTPMSVNESTTTTDFSTSTESSTTTTDSGNSTTSPDFSNTTNSSTILNSTRDPFFNLMPPKKVTKPIQNFNTALDQVFTDEITVAWDEAAQKFHFVVPDKAFRHYEITYKVYQDMTTHDDRTLAFRVLPPPATRSRNLTEPYTCHYNVKNNCTMCVSIDDRLVTVGLYRKQEEVKETRFTLPNYLSFDKFFSYADGQGDDYILIHHRGQWIYRINYRMYLLDQNMFFKVFQLKTHDAIFEFDDFEHADEFGLVTRYADYDGHYRYYYSLFNEISGLTTYCVHDKYIDGRLMIIGREKIEPIKTATEALRQTLNIEKGEEYEFPTMLRVLFYCSLVYLSIFLTSQMIPYKKQDVMRDLRHTDREIQRLAPVIESVMKKVHAFLEGTKKEGTKKEKVKKNK